MTHFLEQVLEIPTAAKNTEFPHLHTLGEADYR
jgi:hypothetical protein